MAKNVKTAIKAPFKSRCASPPCGPISVFFLLLPFHPRVGAYIPRSFCRPGLRHVHQTTFKTSYSFSPAVSRNTVVQDDCFQHCVLGILRDRLRPLSRSSVVASRIVECGDVHVHDLDGPRLPRSLCRLDFVERERYQLGAGVV